MEIFFTIITVLILIVPVVAKAIEKKLVQAGRQDTAGKVRRFREQFEDRDTERKNVLDEPFPTVVFSPEVRNCPEKPPQAGDAVTDTDARVLEALPGNASRSVKDIVAERGRLASYASAEPLPEKDGRLEIDPRKLILYSEIMKTKF